LPLERFSHQRLAASEPQVLSRPLPGPHPALSLRGLCTKLRIEDRIDEFISIKIQ
jgi:hypothetical protein